MIRGSDVPKPGTRPKLFIPLLEDYYIFDYFRFLVPRLLEDGFAVTLYAFDQTCLEKYAVDHPAYRGKIGGWWLRGLHNRHTRLLPRVLLWLSGWIWSAGIARNYDFAIVPWDYRPLWYAVARSMPAMTLSTTTIVMDPDLEIEDRCLPESQEPGRMHWLAVIADRLTGGRFLPRLGERTEKYQPKLLWVDRLMGWRATGHLLGASGATFVAVPGEQIRDNFVHFGIPKDRVKAVGVPGYEFLHGLSQAFDEPARHRFCAEIGLDPARKIFSFFLSPSTFSQTMIDEVALVARSIRKRYADSIIVLKFHPKTRRQEPPRFRNALAELGDDLVLFTEYRGDETNARLVLSSHAIVQKQSTVGFIALLLNVPIISYDLLETGYQDRMYKILDASFHAENLVELETILENLESPASLAELRERQRLACQRFCLDVTSPCTEISKLIRGYLDSGQPHVHHGISSTA